MVKNSRKLNNVPYILSRPTSICKWMEEFLKLDTRNLKKNGKKNLERDNQEEEEISRFRAVSNSQNSTS